MLLLLPRSVYSFPVFLSGSATAFLAGLVWKRRTSGSAISLSLYLLSTAIWSIGYGLQLESVALEQQIFWSKVEYLGPAGVSLAGLVFVLQYCGFANWVTARRIGFLALVPAVTQILVWTNEYHHLIWRRIWLDPTAPFPMMARTHGIAFWFFLFYDYSLCLVAIILLLRAFVVRGGIYRSHVPIILIGSLIPFIGNWLYSFGIVVLPDFDLTVFGFMITGLSMAWALFRSRWPLIIPLARQNVFEELNDGVIAIDQAGHVVELNPEAARILAQASTHLIGRPAMVAFRAHPQLVRFLTDPKATRAELRLGNARTFEVHRSLLETQKRKVIGSLIVLRDITERKVTEERLWEGQAALEQRIAERTSDLSRTIEDLRQLENELTFSASHDNLTQLPNRKLFLDRVTQRLETAGEGPPFVVLYVDLDRFKIYNDGYGHHVGDLILVEIGKRLKSCLQQSDTVARMGGDEFTILIDKVATIEAAASVARDLLEAIATPVELDGLEVHLTASIGLAGSYPGCDAEGLVGDADLAMYHAKRQGGNQSEFFGESMRSAALVLVQLQQDLRLAVLRNQMVVQYQPFVHLKTGQVVGFEALVRWRHPERGLLSPAAFLPVAEQTGMLISIDEFVLHEACRQKSFWSRLTPAGSETPFVSVNVAGWQFTHPRRWRRDLASLHSQTAGLRLEMLESVLVTNSHAAVEFFENIRAHNIEIYLDDFGTGYSSLSSAFTLSDP